MQFRKNGDHLLEFIRLDPFLAELIRQIPCAADPRDEANANARLFSKPVESGSNDAGLLEDWEDLIVPELKLQFGSALAQVTHDISENLSEADGEEDFPYRLQIPLEHVDAWLSALNQARLVLAERYSFSDEELNHSHRMELKSLRDLALYQISIYALIQELIISAL